MFIFDPPPHSIKPLPWRCLVSASDGSRFPLLIWLMNRHGVPTSTLRPFRRERVWRLYDSPLWNTMVDSPRGRATLFRYWFTFQAISQVGRNTIIDTSLPFLIRPVRYSELPFSSSRPWSLVMAVITNARVLPMPIRYHLMTSRTANAGTKALVWTGVKLVIPFPDSMLMTFWVYPFLVQYDFEVKVNLRFRQLTLDGTSTPSSSDNDNNNSPSRCPPSIWCCCMSPRSPILVVMGSISSPLPSASLRAPDRMPWRSALRSPSTVE